MNIDYISKRVQGSASDRDLVGAMIFPPLLILYIPFFFVSLPVAVLALLALELLSLYALIRIVRRAALYTTVFAGIMQFSLCTLATGYPLRELFQWYFRGH